MMGLIRAGVCLRRWRSLRVWWRNTTTEAARERSFRSHGRSPRAWPLPGWWALYAHSWRHDVERRRLAPLIRWRASTSAVELAAYVSSEPGPGGEPLYEWIDVREVMSQAPSED